MARPSLFFFDGLENLQIPKDGHWEIAADRKDHGGVVLQRWSGWDDIRNPDRCLALIAAQGSHITLQSRCESCFIVPPELNLNLGHEARGKIPLKQSTRDCQYNVVLRPNDRVFLWSEEGDPCRCSFTVRLEDIQVESSLPTNQGQRAGIDGMSQQTDSQLEKYSRPSPTTSGGLEEASNIQKESKERCAHEQVLAATPVASSTGTSQIVKDTPATNRRLGTSLLDARLAHRARPGLVSHSTEGVSLWQGNAGALSHSASTTTIDPRDLSVQDPEEDEDDKVAEESDEEDNEDDLVSVKNLKPAFESLHANGTSKLRSASYEQAEKASGFEGQCDDPYDYEDAQSIKREEPLGRSSSPRVVITLTSLATKRKASEEESARPTKRTGRVKESENFWNSPSKSPAGYGRRAQAKRRAAKAPRDESKTAWSSNCSRRSSIDEGSDVSKDAPIRVVFSNSTVVDRSSPMKFLGKKGVRVLDNVTSNGYDFLCVKSNGDIKKSFKLLMSVISGITIITDKWVTESHKAEKLLDIDGFIPTNAPPEWDWGDSQEDVLAALRRDRSNLFKGLEVFVTPAMKIEYEPGYKNVKKLLEATGVSKVTSKLVRSQDFDDDTIVIGSMKADPDAMKLAAKGNRCFNKDFISMAILRGRLDLDGFKLYLDSPKKTGKVSRRRKSK